MKNIKRCIPMCFKKALAWFCVALLLPACGACGSGGPSATPLPTNSAPASVSPISGGVIRIAMPMNAGPLNPMKLLDKRLVGIMGMVFEPLVQYDANGEILPCLAQEWKMEVLSDGTAQWTFRLRKGVKWHGERGEVSANDVVYSFNLIRSLGENTYYQNRASYITSCEVVDASTVRVIAPTPFYGLLDAMIFPIMPSAYYGAAPDDKMPVGSGPYAVEQYDQASGMRLVRNKQWWKQAPYIDVIEAIPQSEDVATQAIFTDFDVYHTRSIVTTQYQQSGQIMVSDYVTRQYEFLAPNFNAPLFKDIKVRQAIAYAIDQQEIASSVYLNHAIIVDAPLSPDSWLYSVAYNTYETNVTRAKELLKEAGWEDTDGDGKLNNASGQVLHMKILTNERTDSTQRKDAASIIARQLRACGIDASVVAKPWADVQKDITNKNFDLLLAGYYLDRIPDLSFAFTAGGSGNVNGYSTTAMNDLLAAIRQAPDKASFAAAYHALEAFIAQELPHIPLLFRTNSLLMHERLGGFIPGSIWEGAEFASVDQWFVIPDLIQ